MIKLQKNYVKKHKDIQREKAKIEKTVVDKDTLVKKKVIIPDNIWAVLKAKVQLNLAYPQSIVSIDVEDNEWVLIMRGNIYPSDYYMGYKVINKPSIRVTKGSTIRS